VSFRTEPVPQVALLLPVENFRARTARVYAPWDDSLRPVHGALHALLESGYSVDVLAEHQLQGRLAQYPLVVLPECQALAEGFREALGEYLAAGGSILCIGAEAAALFAGETGVRAVGEPTQQPAFLEGAGMLVRCDGTWLKVRAKGAKSLGLRYPTHDLRKGGEIAATVARRGKGRIAAIFGPVASVFRNTHHPALRAFIGRVAREVFPDPAVKLDAPPCVDMSLRRKDGELLVHLANTVGMQMAEKFTVVDFVPSVGPIRLVVRLPKKPRKIVLVGEKGKLRTRWGRGRLHLTLDRLDVHAVVAIEE